MIVVVIKTFILLTKAVLSTLAKHVRWCDYEVGETVTILYYSAKVIVAFVIHYTLHHFMQCLYIRG